MSKILEKTKYKGNWELDIEPSTWLTARDDTAIRDDLIKGNTKTCQPARVDQTVTQFMAWLDRQERTKIRLQDPGGEEVYIDGNHSYSRQYRARYYYALKSIEKWCILNWSTCYTYLLTLTSSNRGDNVRYKEPADHLNDLMSTWDVSTRKRLNEAVSDNRSAWCTVLEPHKSGYAHMHVAVYVDQQISPDELQRVIDAHVRNCPGAGRKAHQVHNSEFGEGTLSGRERNPDDDEEVGDYLGDYVGLSFENWEDMSLHHLFFSSILWATGTRRIRFSDSANRIARTAAGEMQISTPLLDWNFLSIDFFSPSGKLQSQIHEPGRGCTRYMTLDEWNDEYG